MNLKNQPVRTKASQKIVSEKSEQVLQDCLASHSKLPLSAKTISKQMSIAGRLATLVLSATTALPPAAAMAAERNPSPNDQVTYTKCVVLEEERGKIEGKQVCKLMVSCEESSKNQNNAQPIRKNNTAYCRPTEKNYCQAPQACLETKDYTEKQKQTYKPIYEEIPQPKTNPKPTTGAK